MELATSLPRYSQDGRVWAPVLELLRNGVEEEVSPGFVLFVGKGGDLVFHYAVGGRTYPSTKIPEPGAISESTVFDLASLTATVVTSTIVMMLVQSGKISLEDRVCRYEQGFGILGKNQISIEHLLSHTSGLPAWIPFFEDVLREHAGPRRGIVTSRGARDYVYNAINRLALKGEVGGRQVYSDVGLILLGHLIEMLTGVSLDRAAQRLVFQPLGLKSTSFVDLSMIKRRGIHPVTDIIAPTEECPWRKRVLCGEVHDDNAWVMGGVAGHAGLFSSARDLHIFAREMLRAYEGESKVIRKEVVRAFWRGNPLISEGIRYLWDSPSKDNLMLDSGLSSSAVGTNGFTGCSLWIEPEEQIDIILLSNRIHPTRSNKRLMQFRPLLHKRVLEIIRAG